MTLDDLEALFADPKTPRSDVEYVLLECADELIALARAAERLTETNLGSANAIEVAWHSLKGTLESVST